MVDIRPIEPRVVYRGRNITQAEVDFIRSLIIAHPGEGRCALARRACEAWNWTQPNGILKDIVCRGLLLQLERGGYIVLPPRQRSAETMMLCHTDVLLLSHYQEPWLSCREGFLRCHVQGNPDL